MKKALAIIAGLVLLGAIGIAWLGLIPGIQLQSPVVTKTTTGETNDAAVAARRADEANHEVGKLQKAFDEAAADCAEDLTVPCASDMYTAAVELKAASEAAVEADKVLQALAAQSGADAKENATAAQAAVEKASKAVDDAAALDDK